MSNGMTPMAISGMNTLVRPGPFQLPSQEQTLIPSPLTYLPTTGMIVVDWPVPAALETVMLVRL
jgi:hypothetical protein